MLSSPAAKFVATVVVSLLAFVLFALWADAVVLEPAALAVQSLPLR